MIAQGVFVIEQCHLWTAPLLPLDSDETGPFEGFQAPRLCMPAETELVGSPARNLNRGGTFKTRAIPENDCYMEGLTPAPCRLGQPVKGYRPFKKVLTLVVPEIPAS